MQSLLAGFTAPAAALDLSFADAATRKHRTLGDQKLFIFSSGSDVAGELKITVFGGKRIEHAGIRVELRGVVELSADRSTHEVVTLFVDVAPPGVLSGLQALKWAFSKASLPHESYTGINARVRYYVRAVVLKQGYGSGPPVASLTKEADFLVMNAVSAATPATAGASAASAAIAAGGAGASATSDPLDTSVRLEVGIEDCLHIEFQFDSTRLGLGDTVTGHLDFLLVRIRIKHAEIALIRREAAGVPGSSTATNDSETVSRFEVMDGAPVKGERIPLRMPLAGLDVGPSMAGVAGVLSVRYFLNLVLVDEEDRRYFKQCEVTLERRSLT